MWLWVRLCVLERASLGGGASEVVAVVLVMRVCAMTEWTGGGVWREVSPVLQIRRR
jgi:hypothetical protein